MFRTQFIITCLVLAGACSGTLAPSTPKNNLIDRLVSQTTIYRDEYGVPHIEAKTDAGAVFGYIYAQAEDAYADIERNIAQLTGRLSELEGESGLSSDLFVRALETERLCREEYASATKEIQALADAWAAGLNLYRRGHPEEVRWQVETIEPWQMFAIGRSESIWTPTTHAVLSRSEVRAAVGIGEPHTGSNMWMVGPGKSEGHRAMLFINPHSPPETYLEGHVVSDEGLNFYGANRPGRPLPILGFTPRHGWAFTDNQPDVADLWVEHFDHETDPDAYRYGETYRKANRWRETLKVRNGEAYETRELNFRKTHHGPIVAVRDGMPLALRIARWEEGGTIQQLYEMARAPTFSAFKTAVARQHLIWINIGYADSSGNIWYVWNGAVPVRSLKFEWNMPVDGSNPETEWMGYHATEELPQVQNPNAGWLMNTNHSPFRVTAPEENPNPSDFPRYMASAPFGRLPVLIDDKGDNARARASRRILSEPGKLDYEDWRAATLSERVWEADIDIPAWQSSWSRLASEDPARYADLKAAIDMLSGWDRKSGLDSVEMTLYSLMKLTRLWSSFKSDGNSPVRLPPAIKVAPIAWDDWDPVIGLEQVLSILTQQRGDWRIPYGKLVRLQRPGNDGFRDDRPSEPVLGGPDVTGMIRNYLPTPVSDQKYWYGFLSSNSFVAAVGFGKIFHAGTLHGSGQSADPSSMHFTDQATLYGTGSYKSVSLNMRRIKDYAVETYHPGLRDHSN